MSKNFELVRRAGKEVVLFGDSNDSLPTDDGQRAYEPLLRSLKGVELPGEAFGTSDLSNMPGRSCYPPTAPQKRQHPRPRQVPEATSPDPECDTCPGCGNAHALNELFCTKCATFLGKVYCEEQGHRTALETKAETAETRVSRFLSKCWLRRLLRR